jgi:hypothetical protein
MKKRKLAWAKRIIFDMNPPGVTITQLCCGHAKSLINI